MINHKKLKFHSIIHIYYAIVDTNMGIKRLHKFLSEKKLIKKYDSMEKFMQHNHIHKSRIVAVDIMLYIYKYKYSYSDIIYGFMKQIIHFLNNRIIPLYVFDDKPIDEKAYIINNRKNRKRNLVDKINALKEELRTTEKKETSEISTKIAKLKKSYINITNTDIKNIQELLKLCNIPFIRSCNEADISIAKLYKEKKISCCLSEDMDILAFGCKKMIKLFKSNIYEYNLDYILQNLKLTHDQFIDMCILFGCDYIKPIIKNEPDKIYKRISNSEPIREIVGENNEDVDIDKYINDHDKIRDIFKNKFKDSFSHKYKFSIMKKISLDNLLKFLKKKFTEDRTLYLKKSVMPNIKRINNMITNKIFR